VVSLANAYIYVYPMKWTPTGRDNVREYGKQTTPGAVSLEDTKKRLGNIRRFVIIEVCDLSVFSLDYPQLELE
jgi:hypothetical protein